MAYYLHKMILAKTWNKTYNGEFLAIVEPSKHGGIIKKIVSIKFSFLPVITTFTAL